MKIYNFEISRRIIDSIKGLKHIMYHSIVVILSAAIALSLPFLIKLISQKFLLYWSFIENEKLFLVSLEIATAIILIILFNTISRAWRGRKISRVASDAGLLPVTRNGGYFSRRKIKKFKEKQAFARDIMILGSTGFRTFVNPEGDLHTVIQKCRKARILLMHPLSNGVDARAKSLCNPAVTPESFRDQIAKSIEFLKSLKEVRENIRLKLYINRPLWKIAILGEYLFVQHYHIGLDVQDLPEYVFRHNQNPGCFYIPFYQYLVTLWNDPVIPEYDLETGELIYRDKTGYEIKREKFRDILWNTENIIMECIEEPVKVS